MAEKENTDRQDPAAFKDAAASIGAAPTLNAMTRWSIGTSLLALLLITLGPAIFGVDGSVATPSNGTLPLSRLLSIGGALAALFAGLQMALIRAVWRDRITLKVYLFGVWVLATSMTFSLTSTGDAGGFTLAKSIGFQGYAEDGARFESAAALFNEYNTSHSELSPHSATHPPGPALLYRSTSKVAHALASIAPSELGFSSRATLGLAIRENLIGGLVILIGWLWIWPLAGLVRLFGGDRAALVAIGFAAALPGLYVMAPMPDLLHPLLATSAAFVVALASRSRRLGNRLVLGFLAGVLASVLALFSFGNLAVFPMLAVTLFVAGRDRSIGALLPPLAMALLGVSFCYVGLLGLGYSYIEGLQLSLSFHTSGINAQREYWPFLFSSPYTFLLWLTPPVLLGFGRCLGSSGGPQTWLARVALVLILLLAVTGTSRGETERLWLALIPFFILPAACAWSTEDSREPWVPMVLMLAFAFAFQSLTGQYA